jgi:hypothetical protein
MRNKVKWGLSLNRFNLLALLASFAPICLSADFKTDRTETAFRAMSYERSNAKAHLLNQQEQPLQCGFIFDSFPSIGYSSSLHWLTGSSVHGDSIEIEDGSVWKINSYDSYKALSWRANDPLLITQNTRWFSSYNYKIVNRATGSSIEANLILGPLEFGVFTKYIAFIDWAMGDIVLSDNTRYQTSCYDTSAFHDWDVNDAVIVGYNSGWDSSCESILINVNMDNFIRAKQF